jgi:hypothetical protein
LTNPDPELRPIVRYLRHQIGDEDRQSLLIVAIDDVQLPALALGTIVTSMARKRKIVLADLTEDRVFKSMFGDTGKPVERVALAPNSAVTLFAPSRDLGPEEDRAALQLGPERWQRADLVLALATVDLARGASHLRNWDEAIITVTAGQSTPQRISATAELLRASGIGLVSAILFDCDPDDESVGLADGDQWRSRPTADISMRSLT